MTDLTALIKHLHGMASDALGHAYTITLEDAHRIRQAADALGRIEELERRLAPSQGEEYANEVERQRTIIEHLSHAADLRQENHDELVNRLLNLTYASDDGTEYEHVAGCEGQDDCPACWVATIRQAVDGFPDRTTP